MSNVPSLEDQGLEVIVCLNCHAIYYDLKRKNRWALHCVYCGVRPKTV